MDMDPHDTFDTDLSLGLGIGPASTASADDCRRRQRGCCSPCTNLFPDEPSLSLSLSDDASGGGRTMQKAEADRPPQLSSSRSAASSFSSAAYVAIPKKKKKKKKKEEEEDDVGAEVERVSSRGSDEEENSSGRKKLRLTREQSALLEDRFKEHTTLNPKQKQALAKDLNLRPRQVEVWFQNRRARTKLKQTEVDCEFLKKCYEALTNENQRLHKELQELKALKFAQPLLHMQLPSAAAPLTMCPSCQRISGGGGDAKDSSKAPKPGHCLNPFSHSAAC
ncbi:homeobox-leucine zipper protein HOX19-like [Musa acuminata AAA Group]|uniref:homeobox-leucine zipper protein HOX19-like n=1 Tax=Musa acuminata AAA Group TaxID=214697 RepID=UPI0031E155D6